MTPETTIRSRLSALTAKAVRMREQLRLVEDELQELETALKVLDRLGLSEPQERRVFVPKMRTEPGTLGDLISQALVDGPKPISAITQYISDHHSTTPDPNIIRSTAWRMWRTNRIGRTDDRYHLLNKEGPTEAGPSGALGADTGRGRGSEPMIPEGSIPSASTPPFSTGSNESDLC
jgi:hypothetical protein